MADDVPENPDEIGSEDKPTIRDAHAEDLDNKATKGGKPYVDEDRVRELIEESAGALEALDDSLKVPTTSEVGGEDPSTVPEGEALPPPSLRDSTPPESPLSPPEIPDIPVPPLEPIPDLNLTARFEGGGDDVPPSPPPSLTSTEIPGAPDAPDTPAPARSERPPDVAYPSREVAEDVRKPLEDFTQVGGEGHPRAPLPEAPTEDPTVPTDTTVMPPDVAIPAPPEGPVIDAGELPETTGPAEAPKKDPIRGLDFIPDIEIPPIATPVPYEQPAPLPEMANPQPPPAGGVMNDPVPFIPVGGEYELMPDWDGRDALDLVVGTEVEKQLELEVWADLLEGYISGKGVADDSGGRLPHPWAIWCGVDKNGVLVLMATVEYENAADGTNLQTGFDGLDTVIGSFTTSIGSYGIAGEGSLDMRMIPVYNGARPEGGCDKDTFEAVPDIVGDPEITDEYPNGKYPDADPLEVPDPDDDTDFNEASVADVKVSDGTSSCIKKVDFHSKKILQSECDKVLLQEDAVQNDSVYGFATDFAKNPKTVTASMDGTTLEFECGVLVDKETTGGGTSCDEDTYEMVHSSDDPNTLPDADDDTDFDSGSVADVKVSAPYGCFGPAGSPVSFFNEEDCLEEEYGGEPVNSWQEASCVRKIEFQNKKLLQNECNKVVLQEDASGGQAEAVFGLDKTPIFVPLWEISWDSDEDREFHLQILPVDPDFDTFLGCMVMLPPIEGSEYNPSGVDPCCDYS